MGTIVIAVYRPNKGHESELKKLVIDHVPRLRKLGYATSRTPIAMQAEDGTILEVFEWVSKEAIDKAHGDLQIHAMWNEFNKVCTYHPVNEVDECRNMFPGFEPLY